MDNNINLSANMQSRLPAPLQAFMKTAGDIAFSEGTRLYLVGGLVRDLLGIPSSSVAAAATARPGSFGETEVMA